MVFYWIQFPKLYHSLFAARGTEMSAHQNLSGTLRQCPKTDQHSRQKRAARILAKLFSFSYVQLIPKRILIDEFIFLIFCLDKFLAINYNYFVAK